MTPFLRVNLSRSFSSVVTLFLASLVVVAGCNGGETRDGARDWNAQRRRMVNEQLRARDIHSARVLDAMLAVPRHLFVPEPERDRAYGEFPF